MSKHTPGPWTIEEYGDDDAPALVIHKNSQTRVCFMATPGSHGDPARIEADARLIVAAPDLFTALEDLERAAIAMLDCTDGSESGYLREEAAKARDAIAKAEGCGR